MSGDLRSMPLPSGVADDARMTVRAQRRGSLARRSELRTIVGAERVEADALERVQRTFEPFGLGLGATACLRARRGEARRRRQTLR
jgi:hypothetical protein